MGRHVAKVVAGRLEGRPAPAPFVYKDRGSMATIGRKDAVVHTKKLQLSGMPAWLMWVVVHLAFLVGFDNRLLVFIQWTWYWLTYKQGTRLITENYRGHEDPRHTEVCASDELA